MPRDAAHLHTALQAEKRSLHPASEHWAELLHRMAGSSVVCIGEASHGTEEFYRLRARLTQELIREHGFTAVIVEADWPDAYRVNRFVRGLPAPEDGPDRTPDEALRGFKRFPAWMWRNAPVRDFIEWLRDCNSSAENRVQAGFYGMDLYSLYRSIEAVIHYLDRADPDAARRARIRYACFEQFEADPQHYGYAAGTGLADPCESEVINQLRELQRRASDLAQRDGRILPDEFFYAEQNARLVKNAEQYYRSMYRGRASSWNLRDTHMADTIDALLTHLLKQDGQVKAVIWAHNSHLGDARATQMGRRGEINVGQLMRQRHPGQSFHLGFTTYAGTVLAASDWDGPPQTKRVRPGLNGSYEELFHDLGGDFWLPLSERDAARAPLLAAGDRLERAIGVIYLPETERSSHYFEASLPEQFDAVIHVDVTHALEALDPPVPMPSLDVPETYPTAV